MAPNKPIPTANAGDPPPFEQGIPDQERQDNDGAEQNDQSNPDAASQNEADAADPGDNTTQPLGDTDPEMSFLDDEQGQGLHEKTAIGTQDIRDIVGSLQPLSTVSSPDSFEPLSDALGHLANADRQATFGQHEGAAVSVGHAVQSLQRAADAEPDPNVRGAISDHIDRAVDAGNKLLDQNESRPPWNPLPAKSRKGIGFANV